MIQIGGTLTIDLKKDKYKFGKTNFTGKGDKNVIMALFLNLYGKDEHQIINHILNSKNSTIEKTDLSGISKIIHNFQLGSKENSDFVKIFKTLPSSQRSEVLKQIKLRNNKRKEDLESYTVIDKGHKELFDVGLKQYEKLLRIHELLDIPEESRLHTYLFSKPIKNKNRLSKKEKKMLKKQQRKSKKKIRN